jgi:Right handed beta helix region
MGRTGSALGLLVALVLASVGCGAPSEAAAPARPTPQWDGTFGPRFVNPDCHGDVEDPQPGDVVCFSDRGRPLKIAVGGTRDAPITYSGDGNTRVPGIRAEADNIVIQGFLSDGAEDTGIWASGENVTIQDNTVRRVRYAGNDLDGIRFFGDGAQVLHNSVRELEGTADIGGSHVDCMQTFATSRPGSQNVVIQGNRCEGIRAQCLMAEGPNVADGSGEGVSRNWLFEGNYCDAHAAAQSVAIQDVQNVTIARNVMAGKGNKAFALGQGSTGVTVTDDNRIGPDYRRAVGFDDPSVQEGYRGPPGH